MIYIIMIAGGLLFVFIKTLIDERNRKKFIKNRIKKSWGKDSEREYLAEEFEKLSHYFYSHKNNDFYIDDITWNDLDMDTIFMSMNHTYSSVGEEYLYYLLRTPCFSQSELEERDRLIEYFAEQEEERLKLQLIFSKIGRNKKVSIIDYIYRVAELEEKSILPHIGMIALFFVTMVIMGITPQLGVPLFVLAIGNNIIQYYKEKAKIEPYIHSFAHIMKLINGADDIVKLDSKGIPSYTIRIKESKDKFKKYKRNSYLLVSGGSMSGSLMDIFMDYARMIFHLDLIKFYSMLHEVKSNIEEIELLLSDLGTIESSIAIGSYRKSLPYYSKPCLKNGTEKYIKGEECYHPMIADPVVNSIEETRGSLITGSNASGKSTFLKTLAINGIFAQTVYTCTAKSYESNFCRLYTSMALKDNLMGQESYYIVEIKALKRILDEKSQVPVLCFIDEVLRGTNTVERIAASSQILKSLAKGNILCFAATHDIELTYLLEPYYSNYHFQEEIKNRDILFHYKLYKGRASSRNAIQLLKMIGYSEDIISEAEQTAADFMETGTWTL